MTTHAATASARPRTGGAHARRRRSRVRQLARLGVLAGPLVAASVIAAPLVLSGAPEPAEAAAGDSGATSEVAAPEPTAPEPPQVVPGAFFALEHATGSRYGIDVSWPQCEQVLPRLPIDFAVIGLTDGQAESVSPCLAEQVAWAKSVKAQVGFYVVPNSPSADTLSRAADLGQCAADDAECLYFQAGVLQAQHALAAAEAADVSARTWWLDVEESYYGTLWGEDLDANVAVLQGWRAELERTRHEVGVYSTDGYWAMITGGWSVDLPQWVAVGESGFAAAEAACAQPFTTGPVVLTQWLTGPLDGNLVCPGQGTAARDLFGSWSRAKTTGVPELLLIPVPHPHPELDKPEKGDKDKKAKDKKAKRDDKEGPGNAEAPDKNGPSSEPKPTPAPTPPSHPTPKPPPPKPPHPNPAPHPDPSPPPKPPHPKPPPTPTPTPTPTPSPTTPTTASLPG